jgi:hypothetical protein
MKVWTPGGLFLGLAAAVSVLGCTSIVDHFSGRKEACEILAVGVPANAKIVRLIDTGTTINNDPVVDFELEVRPPDGEAYSAHSKGLVSRLDIPQVQPGRIVAVKFDPKDRTRVALDMWDCSRR